MTKEEKGYMIAWVKQGRRFWKDRMGPDEGKNVGIYYKKILGLIRSASTEEVADEHQE